MPYAGGQRLTGSEQASKLGHLDVVNSPFVRSLIDQFEYPAAAPEELEQDFLQTFDPGSAEPLPTVLAVDGSLQVIKSDQYPTRSLAFVKTALVRLDRRKLERIDKEYPHPILMKEIMSESALHHSTVLPLRNAKIEGSNNYDLVRNIIRESLLRQHDGLTHKSLKWLAYQKWDVAARHRSPSFECPHCQAETQGLPFDADEGHCLHCGGEVFISDMIGFHLEMGEEEAPESIANAYMLVNELLLLFSYIQHMWGRGNFEKLSNSLLLKDGPLSLRAQYSKLVPNIRVFLEFAKMRGAPVHLAGQEKTGKFIDHFAEIQRHISPKTRADPASYAVLSHEYIRQHVDHAPDRMNAYGKRTNFGEKVLVKLDPYSWFALSVPTGIYDPSPEFPRGSEDLIGLDRILATLPKLISYQNENALIPIALAHGVASLSSYPSAAVLKLFAGL